MKTSATPTGALAISLSQCSDTPPCHNWIWLSGEELAPRGCALREQQKSTVIYLHINETRFTTEFSKIRGEDCELVIINHASLHGFEVITSYDGEKFTTTKLKIREHITVFEGQWFSIRSSSTFKAVCIFTNLGHLIDDD